MRYIDACEEPWLIDRLNKAHVSPARMHAWAQQGHPAVALVGGGKTSHEQSRMSATKATSDSPTLPAALMV